jgi:hypothetical protein
LHKKTCGQNIGEIDYRFFNWATITRPSYRSSDQQHQQVFACQPLCRSGNPWVSHQPNPSLRLLSAMCPLQVLIFVLMGNHEWRHSYIRQGIKDFWQPKISSYEVGPKNEPAKWVFKCIAGLKSHGLKLLYLSKYLLLFLSPIQIVRSYKFLLLSSK